ncbi:unnamed protein product [Bemisia tabaci]|uniref:ubiquitinyl hydrolase 1 n=1 Tax=Bemisia tabaci TaxID=7038 RepID=A0A9N9ZWW0_BEMTA|nr:unnamed protein product [Bemisia tabaci]
MEEELKRILPAITSVFGGSFLNFKNASFLETGNREQLLVDLLSSYLRSELSKSGTEDLYGPIRSQISAICKLLELWSSDLSNIYWIRNHKCPEEKARKVARYFLQRIQNFKDCTIIPSGLISTSHSHKIMNEITGSHDHANIAILKRDYKDNCIDWIHVNPGSAYHQHCGSLTGQNVRSVFEINKIDPANITEDFLFLLVGLKAIKPGVSLPDDTYYKEVSLYECLLVFLNGETTFQSHHDENFIPFSPISFVHTWQVIEQAFGYLLQHFIGEAYRTVHQTLLTGFKISLVEKTFSSHQNCGTQLSHFLLQEICRESAQQAFDHGSEKQKFHSLKLIDEIKEFMKETCHSQELLASQKLHLSEICDSSLSFCAPNLKKHVLTSQCLSLPVLKVEPKFVKPSKDDNIIAYLKKFKNSFVEVLINSNDLVDVALLSFGIEMFFIDYLANTDILQASEGSPFCSDDTFLAKMLIDLAEAFHNCQGKLLDHFLSNLPYQPNLFAKNVIIQFFVYASVAALNLRDQRIMDLLKNYNLSVAISDTISLIDIIPHLVIPNAAWLKVLLSLKSFFTQKEGQKSLFSHSKFYKSLFSFEISNNAETENTDVEFAYLLLQTDLQKYFQFINDNSHLGFEKYNRKWQKLAYTDEYLPTIYHLLLKIAYFAKVSLIKIPSWKNNKQIKVGWHFKNSTFYNAPKWVVGRTEYWRSIVHFKIDSKTVSTKPDTNLITSYCLKGPYQRLIINEENVFTPHDHLMEDEVIENEDGEPASISSCHRSENEIIASQNLKPCTMDRIRYLQLGFLQSVPLLKIERLFIALKELQLDVCCEEDCILIKQTLFEISALRNTEAGTCSLLQWTANENPALIHQLGLLFIEKALVMQHRLTQHQALGNILEISLGLLSFYPVEFKDEFIKHLTEIYYLLKKFIVQPPSHLSDSTLLHLNAYLIISVQVKPELLELETPTVLKALIAIQKYEAEGSRLDNDVLLKMYFSSFIWCSRIQNYLKRNENLLNDILASVIPHWNKKNKWLMDESRSLFSCEEYTVKPLLGTIYYQNRPIVGLPNSILNHKIFKDYLSQANFAVMPGTRKIDGNKLPCYHSVDHSPKTRLTHTKDTLLIEEFIKGSYQRFIPAEELFGGRCYPAFILRSPDSEQSFSHWLVDDQKLLLVKDKNRQVMYQWDLEKNFLFSPEESGFVVPWENFKNSTFKDCLEGFELSCWIEVIAQTFPDGLVQFQSLHFPRLGLHFYMKEGKFYCQQIHGYYIAKLQSINSLYGFSNYLILEKKEPNSTSRKIKVVIPHRQVFPSDEFWDKTVFTNLEEVQTPAYFVYDFDQKTGLLKCHHTRAQLYLALLYYCCASLDDHDASNINSYHLSRENLEACWKDQPFDEVELDIIAQFIDPVRMRDFHPHRIALYLKVISLLSSSVQLAFLYMDKPSIESKDTSYALLRKCDEYLPYLISQYIQHKSTISLTVRLSFEEEETIMRRCPDLFQEYKQLYFNQKPWIDVSVESNKSYKDHYGMLFDKESMVKTSFVHLFTTNITEFNFITKQDEVDFSSGFHRILLNIFGLDNFITLYKLAKCAKKLAITIEKYLYLLHHMVFRAKINYDRFPKKLVMMLARVLLLVVENPIFFPDPPPWFGVGAEYVDLSKRWVTRNDLMDNFGEFCWKPTKIYETRREEQDDRREAQIQHNEENSVIWHNFSRSDLDSQSRPKRFPENPMNFQLTYEKDVTFRDATKLLKVRTLYLEAAYNDSMYQFFERVLSLCDRLKYKSSMGWSIAPFTGNSVTVRFSAEKFATSIAQPVNWEKWTIPHEPLIDLNEYFVSNPLSLPNTEFLFDAQLAKPANEYQYQFCKELKASWMIYHNETQLSYSWLNPQCQGKLENTLQMKHQEICQRAQIIWGIISEQLKQRPNSESDNYFALRWHTGQVLHYHKGDVLQLLVEPHKLATYNPDCFDKHDYIIQKLLLYVSLEIQASKINRDLALIEQSKKSGSEVEQFSILQSLVSSLKEHINPASFRYPHWFLFQFENEIIVRENQCELIESMLKGKEKAMYQLNMGEGKSSVILPLLCSNLANGEQILRINVLSALLATMKNFLRQRFSGLIKKHVYTLPFQRDTDVSPQNLKLILEVLEKCQKDRHILLVTPEFHLCLQLKLRELMLENQEQIGATGVFNWETYRRRVPCKIEEYKDLESAEKENLLKKQDECLRVCLQKEKYLNSKDGILKVPPSGQGSKKFAQFKETINDPTFREWSCLKAAYRELLYNSTLGYEDSSKKLSLLNKIDELPIMDLLDESDEILKHGTELNYSVGDKFVFAGEELRWEIPQFFIQAIFCDLEVRDIISQGKVDGFTVLNLNYSPRGGVPFIQLLNEPYYEKYIKPILIEKYFTNIVSSLRKYNVKADESVIEDETCTLRQYVAAELSSDAEKKLLHFIADKGQLKDKILIAKGWLSHGILFHVFNAKYRVQYGLNLNQQLEGHRMKSIAIPFFGKDAPSPRSEFSHPDVMLGFTIISYLYQGLNEQQLKETFLRLKDEFSHQVADSHLQAWAEASRTWIEPLTDSFPPRMLTSLKHLDLSDEQCLNKVHEFLSCNPPAILFYLNQFVFMLDAMQYLYKISANAHSLVGYNAALGFSGTDDRKLTMPFQIKSLRSATQEGTNGKLLSVLTQERNSSYHSLQVEDTNTLLEQLCTYVSKQSHCHALIDAGALVTGLSNYETALFLLERLPVNILGVLYFSDEGNSLTVLTRNNKSMPLQDCFLDEQSLFAYLDDIHTRGTDIKLPLNCHAILTVGMGMQKDKLMQAAMRLRHLAVKQSVSLWGTEATTLAIARNSSVEKAKINSYEVIKWVTQNTIDLISSDLFPVTVRKINFQFLKKAEIWLKEAPEKLDSLVKYCKDKERFSLEEFYAVTPEDQDLADCLYYLVAGRVRAFYQEIEKELRIKQLCNTDFYKKLTNPSDKRIFREELDKICKEVVSYLQTGRVLDSLDNDEEKEVEVEIIEEQEFSIKVGSRSFYTELDWNVNLIFRRDFVALARREGYIEPIHFIKKYVQMPADMKNILWHSDIYMTRNFVQSVEVKGKELLDNYLRPVDVIFIHRRGGTTRLILLSGQEAAQIKIKCYKKLNHNNLLVHLHDINGETQLPVSSLVCEREQKLLTIVKLFSGECQFKSSSEVQCLTKFVGRLYPKCFTNSIFPVDDNVSEKIYDVLIRSGYLDFSGTMTRKLLKLLAPDNSEDTPTFALTDETQIYCEHVLESLHQIYKELIVQSSKSMRENLNTLREWVGTRGRLKDYVGSSLESILNLEKELMILS